MRLMLALPVLALSACMQTSKIEDSRPVPVNPAMMSDIKADVTRDFFDPASAQFRNVRAVDVSLASGQRERRVCGEVNGKNRLGGYVGFEMFGGVVVGGDFRQRDFFSACEPW